MRLIQAGLAVFVALLLPATVSPQVVHYACDAPVILDPFDRLHLDHTGQSIAVGHFNDDAFKDIVMGGYNREAPEDPTPGDSITRIFVFLGTGNSPGSGQPLFRHCLTITGEATYDLFGFDVAFIGDLNTDGCNELVVGAPKFGPTDAGRVWVYSGLPGLLPTTDPPVNLPASGAAFTFDGTLADGWFGASVATAQTAGGAFLTDLLVGAPGNSVTSTTVKGSAFLYEAPTMVEASSLGVSLPGLAIGASTVIGTPGISGSVGSGYIVTAHRPLHGLAFGDCFGWSVAFVGDLHSAPGQEFLVGAPQYAPESGLPTTKGKGYVQRFRKDSSTELLTISGTQGPNNDPRQEGEAFGFAVAGGFALDPATDLVPDLLVGAPLFNVGATGGPGTGMIKAGRVRAFSGAHAAAGTAAPIQSLESGLPDETVLTGQSGSEEFGCAVVAMSDLNGDGTPEILVGAWRGGIASATECNPPQHPPLATGYGGYAALFTADTGARLVTFYGEAFKDHLGRAVAAADLFGTASLSEIVLSGVGWNPLGQENPAEIGRGYVWNGDAVLQP